MQTLIGILILVVSAMLCIIASMWGITNRLKREKAEAYKRGLLAPDEEREHAQDWDIWEGEQWTVEHRVAMLESRIAKLEGEEHKLKPNTIT